MLSVATTISYEEAAESGANSPRTKVAEKLKGLEVSSEDGSEIPSSSQSPRKKLKRMPGIRSGDRDVALSTPRQEVSPSRELEIPDSEGPTLLELSSRTTEVTMDARTPSSSPTPVVPPHRRTLTKVPSLRKDSSYLSTRTDPSPPLPPTSSPPQATKAKRRLSSPPPPTLESMTLDPTPLSSDSNAHDQSHLTWHIDEITGHDIDAGNPDDDGEGINGIGFKPTPAMAYARSLKRKKQVEEWKSREAREARQRRLERRKRGGGGSSDPVDEGEVGVGVGGKRTVRFVEG